MQGELRIRRLRWLCRRGMKELDVLLESFLANNEENLKAGGWAEFETLLNEEDDYLWDVLQRPERNRSCQYAPLIDAIRNGS